MITSSMFFKKLCNPWSLNLVELGCQAPVSYPRSLARWEASDRQDPGLFPRLGVSRGGTGGASLSFLKEPLLPRVRVPVDSLPD